MKKLKEMGVRHTPHPIARMARLLLSYPRYGYQMRKSRQGFSRYGSRYPQHILFIAGLPKSGTTWLEKMLGSFPGFHEIMFPEAVHFELKHGGSHRHDLPDDIFSRFRGCLAVLKVHVHGSAHNVGLLHTAGLRYVVLYRDLRDVAVSYCYYVRKTPWHPEFRIYSRMTIPEGLKHFSRELLPQYAEWVKSWRRHHDPARSLEIRYEDLLTDTVRNLSAVATHFRLEGPEEAVRSIAGLHSFQRLSGGRNPGDQKAESFFRKGISGDWINHFTPEINRAFKEKIGEFLVEFGFEKNESW